MIVFSRIVLVLLFLSLYLSPATGQENTGETSIKLHGGIDRSFLTSSITGNTAGLWLLNKYTVEFKPISDGLELGKVLVPSAPLNRKKTFYSSREAHGLEDGRHWMFFSDKKRRTFSSLMTDFESHELKSRTYDIKLKGERFLVSSFGGNDYYVVTVKKESPALVFYKFFPEGRYERFEVNLDMVEFGKRYSDLYSFLFYSDTGIAVFNSVDGVRQLQKLSRTKRKWKFYFLKNDQVIFTLDHDKTHTLLLEIDLTTGSVRKTRVDKGYEGCGEKVKKVSNSLYAQGKLWQVTACKTHFNLDIKELSTKNTLKHYGFNEEEAIKFKNGYIRFRSEVGVETKADLGHLKPKESDDTKKFLKFLLKYGVALAVNDCNEDNLQLSVGGHVPYSSGWSNYMSGHGGYMPGYSGTGSFYIPYMATLESISFFNSILSKDGLEHRKRWGAGKTALEKMSRYTSELSKRASAVARSSYKKGYLLGYQDLDSNHYHLKYFLSETE